MSKIPDLLRAEEARQALARMVCDERVSPLSFCSERETFKNLLDAMNPAISSNFKFQSLKRNCLKIYAEKRKQVKETFLKLHGRISLSVDTLMFEKPQMSIDFRMRVAAHFIDNDWKLRKWVIKYCGVYGEEEECPTEVIFNSLKDWDIESKVLTLTLGEGGSVDLTDLVKEEMGGGKDLPLNGELFGAQCSSDIISRMVQKGFEMIDSIINKIQMLSWSQSLPLWYLTTSKLKSALELEAMGEFSSGVSKNYLPSKEEWGKVRSMCRIADQIHDIVEPLFALKRPTSNLFLPHLLEIRAYLTQQLADPVEFVKVVARKMLHTFDEYWKNMYLVLAIAAFLDPRYKMKFIVFSFSKLEGDADGDLKAATVLETIHKLYDNYILPSHQKEYLLDESSSEDEDAEDEEKESDRHSKKLCRRLGDRLNILSQYRWSVQSSNNQPHKSDLDLYLEEPTLQWSENFSVLLWWKDNCSRYPNLSRMARDFLAIPMSVATSYGAYYTEPRPADRTLSNLKPELMNALACTRSWKDSHMKHKQDVAVGNP